MSDYILHNFEDGQVLNAQALNEMDSELSNLKEDLGEMDSRLSESITEIQDGWKLNFSGDGGARIDTPFPVKTGSKVLIDVQSITGFVTIYTTGHTDYAETISSAKDLNPFAFVPKYDGTIRFYNGSPFSINANVHVETRYDRGIDDVNEKLEPLIVGHDVSSLASIDIITNRLTDGIVFDSCNYDLKQGDNIENYERHRIDSTIAKCTKPIRVRNASGNLIYNDLKLDNKDRITSSTGGACMFTFDLNGDFLRVVRYAEYKERTDTFLNDEYFAILIEFPTVYSYLYWVVSDVNIEWLNNDVRKAVTNMGMTYFVGNGGDFATVTEMLVALKNNDKPKTVYIKSGIYDVFAEMGGASYFDGLEDLEAIAWRTYCNLIPPNTKIIGLGYVELDFDYTKTRRKNREVFSCLNASTGTHIENITVRQTGGRYGIHFEGGQLAETKGNAYTLKNVNVYTDGAISSVGIGMNEYTDLTVDGCTLVSKNADNGWCLFHHTNHHLPQKIAIENSIIDGILYLQNWGNNANGNNTVDTQIKNSYVKALYVIAPSTSVTISDYDITICGVNDYEFLEKNVTAKIKKYA